MKVEENVDEPIKEAIKSRIGLINEAIREVILNIEHIIEEKGVLEKGDADDILLDFIEIGYRLNDLESMISWTRRTERACTFVRELRDGLQTIELELRKKLHFTESKKIFSSEAYKIQRKLNEIARRLRYLPRMLDEKEMVLEELLRHSCDGFEDIEVESREPLILRFITWDKKVFRMKVDGIELLEEKEVKRWKKE